ncbi:MAG TPA: hypothetical protein DCY00_01195, partial [Actinobacteria bacterium]|nr:hypothetical protein [Actinomycetota bacterium]
MFIVKIDNNLEIQKLKSRIKKEEVIKKISNRCFKGKIYLVGGAIRELYLRKKPDDYDFVLSDKNDLSIIESLFGRG